MNKYVELFRPVNTVMGFLGIIGGALIAAGLDVADYWKEIAVASAVVVLFICGGNALNDYIDRDIDKVSHPGRPIPSGRLKPRSALYAGGSAFAVSIAVSFIFLFWNDYLSFSIVIAACVLMLSYELFLKQRGFVGNIAVSSLSGGLFLLGGAVAQNIEIVIPAALIAVIANIGREIVKDIEDMEGDEGRFTLPMRIGVKRAGIVAGVMFAAAVGLSFWPIFTDTFGPLYYLIFAGDALVIYSTCIILKDAHLSQKLCKFAMMVALAAFILGAVYT